MSSQDTVFLFLTQLGFPRNTITYIRAQVLPYAMRDRRLRGEHLLIMSHCWLWRGWRCSGDDSQTYRKTCDKKKGNEKQHKLVLFVPDFSPTFASEILTICTEKRHFFDPLNLWNRTSSHRRWVTLPGQLPHSMSSASTESTCGSAVFLKLIWTNICSQVFMVQIWERLSCGRKKGTPEANRWELLKLQHWISFQCTQTHRLVLQLSYPSG